MTESEALRAFIEDEMSWMEGFALGLQEGAPQPASDMLARLGYCRADIGWRIRLAQMAYAPT